MQEGKTKRSPGRPRAFDRDLALQAALDLYWRHGYEGTSVAELTKAMKINPPSFYAAFGTKEALFREVLDLYLKNNANFVTRNLGGDQDARASVEAMLRGAVQAFTREGAPRGCMVGSGSLHTSGESTALALVLGGIRSRTRDFVQMRLARAMAEGELPPDTDVQALAAYFSALVQGLSVQAIDGAPAELLERIVETAMKIWPAAA
jgi:AcrR family transcriptional regulator